MDLAGQTNGFYKWLSYHQNTCDPDLRLKHYSIALWHALAYLSWVRGTDAVSVDVNTLSTLTGFKNSSVKRGREELLEHGLLIQNLGEGSRSATYELQQFVVLTGPQIETDNFVVPTGPQMEPQIDADVDKLKVCGSHRTTNPNCGPDRTTNPLPSLICNKYDDDYILAKANNISLLPEAIYKLKAIYKNAELDFLTPPDWQKIIADAIFQMFTRKSIWVNKVEIPQAEIQSRLLDIHKDNLQYMVDQLGQGAGEMVHPIPYIMACIYNAPPNYDLYLTMEVAKDNPKIRRANEW